MSERSKKMWLEYRVNWVVSSVYSEHFSRFCNAPPTRKIECSFWSTFNVAWCSHGIQGQSKRCRYATINFLHFCINHLSSTLTKWLIVFMLINVESQRSSTPDLHETKADDIPNSSSLPQLTTSLPHPSEIFSPSQPSVVTGHQRQVTHQASSSNQISSGKHRFHPSLKHTQRVWG